MENTKLGVLAWLDTDVVACFDEGLGEQLDKAVLACLDKNNKDYFDVANILTHRLKRYSEPWLFEVNLLV